MAATLKTEQGLGRLVCMRSSSSVGESLLRTRHRGLQEGVKSVINPHARSALTPTADLPFELNCITTSGGIYERETGFLSVFFLSLILACGFSLPASASYTMTVSPSSASVPVGDAQQFIATSDPAGPISWSLVIVYWTGCPRPYCVRHVTSCSGCGTVSPTSTQSGAPTTYTAASIPVSFP